MKDLADNAHQDIALAVLTDEESVAADAHEEVVCTQECQHCGHLPCGCGG